MGSKIFGTTTPFLVYMSLTAVFPFIRKFYRMTMVTKDVEQFFTDLMRQSIQLREEKQTQRDDFLNFLMELKKKKNLSELEMAANTITFFLDGFETSSVVISNVLHQLAQHPECQNRLRKEIHTFINGNGPISAENINDIEYLDNVFNGM